MEEIDEKEGEVEEFSDYIKQMEELRTKDGEVIEQPAISLHALLGTNDCQTMRMKGKIKNQELIMLVDSSSTHNFIDQGVIKKLNCLTQDVKGMNVTVANRQTLVSNEVCKELQWEVQGLIQHSDFMVLPLMGCDLVLGVQWLKTLGPITWDFKILEMQFWRCNFGLI